MEFTLKDEYKNDVHLEIYYIFLSIRVYHWNASHTHRYQLQTDDWFIIFSSGTTFELGSNWLSIIEYDCQAIEIFHGFYS